MNLSILLLFTAMMLFSNVWTVYGVFIDAQQSCTSCNIITSALPMPTHATTLSPSQRSSFTSPEVTTHVTFHPSGNATWSLSTSSIRTSLIAIQQPPLRTGSSSRPARASSGLNTGAKIGIGVAGGILGLVLVVILVFDACYLRRKRRERDVQYALDEVEGGAIKESQERIVLESRVSIVFEEEEDEEGDHSEPHDDADDEDEGERGRNGMSLPRRLLT